VWQIGGHYQGGILISNAAPLLLDAYPNAYTAYSFRKLREAYAGSAVRIREDGGDTEADIGFSGDDFDTAAAATHIGANNGFIVTWYDQSGNGINITQATAGKQPAYATTMGSGNKPTAAFTTGSAHGLASAGSQTISTSVITVTAVYRFNTASAVNGTIWAFDDTGATDILAILRTGGGATGCYHNGFKGEATLSLDTDVYATSICDGANHTMYHLGTGGTPVADTGSIASDAAGADGIFVGERGGNQSPIDGKISEIVVWTADHTASRTGIEANTSSYWGV
jgi:hypothetical protein